MTRVASPNLFSIALLLLGVGCSTVRWEKRIQHVIRTDYSVHDPEFANSISHLLGAPLVPGNSVVELVNGIEIFPAMLEAIRKAEKTITFEQYIWSSGQVSTQFVVALAERARAGVKVHAIADAVGSMRLADWDREQLMEAGVEFVRYNKPLMLWRWNHRTHRKLMVVDGKVGFAGGVCLSDDWMGDAEPDRWRDTHFRIEGPVVGQMQAVFVDNWLQTRSEVLHGADYFPEVPPNGTARAQFFKSGPRDGAENARLTYLLSIAAAQKHIRLAHSYFVPHELISKALIEARQRGVKVEVIVPSKIDHIAVRKAARSRWGELLDAGVEFYEYEPTLYHCKILIVDDAWVSTGSVNVDERSFRINDEANVNVLDAAFAAKLIQSFEEDKSKSRRLSREEFKGRNPLSKFFDHFVGLFKSQL